MDIMAIHDTILCSIIACCRIIRMILECKCIFISVIPHINYRITFSSYSLGCLICSFIRKSVLTSILRSSNSSVIGDSSWSCTNITGRMNCLNKIIVITSGKTLLPDDDRVLCRCIRFPLGINRRCLTDSITETKLCTSGVSAGCRRCSCIPSLERIAFSHHFQKAFITCDLSGFYKSWSIISCTFTILIENKPMSFRSINRKLHIPCYSYLSIIFIIIDGLTANCFCLCSVRIVLDIALSISNNPSFKIVGIIRCITLIYSICCIRQPTRSLCNIGSDSDSFRINICNGILLKNSSIVCYFSICCCKRTSPCHSVGSNIIN